MRRINRVLPGPVVQTYCYMRRDMWCLVLSCQSGFRALILQSWRHIPPKQSLDGAPGRWLRMTHYRIDQNDMSFSRSAHGLVGDWQRLGLEAVLRVCEPRGRISAPGIQRRHGVALDAHGVRVPFAAVRTLAGALKWVEALRAEIAHPDAPHRRRGMAVGAGITLPARQLVQLDQRPRCLEGGPATRCYVEGDRGCPERALVHGQRSKAGNSDEP